MATAVFQKIKTIMKRFVEYFDFQKCHLANTLFAFILTFQSMRLR
jgi:hypothetical protein